ncbi:MAG: hypothetical protein NWE91_09685 [Candidatus Bathyarchaeota archaeon]|nr:hypothetical protein [Candidatus Bathyarchaeota archaeon]
MKGAFNLKRADFVKALKYVPILYVVIAVTIVSAIPWKFTCLEIGRLIGPIPLLDFLVLIPLVIAILSVSFLTPMKLKKNRTIVMFILSLAISFMVIFSFSLVFMPRVSQAGKMIDAFVAENENLGLHDYTNNVSSFLNAHVRNAYNKPEASFRIDIQISSTLLDPYIMKIWGVTRASLIVYQGWGSCGQAAILIEELLHDAGYETRQAHFKNIDHQWAEVINKGKWLIFDPWYIGNLVEIQNLKNIRPEFQQASGVEVQYRNGTIIDASPEHGY